MRFYTFLFLCFISSGIILSSLIGAECTYEVSPHAIYVGPTASHTHRTRKGGAWQSGELLGVQMRYDKVARSKIYWGADLSYAEGLLRGRSSADDRVKSRFIDEWIEGRVGYTFSRKWCFEWSLSPFLGIGYGLEKNRFVVPTPLLLHSKIRYIYVPLGFLGKMRFNDKWDIALQFTAKINANVKNYISHDPDFDDSTLQVDPKVGYRVEVPLNYNYNSRWFFSISPYYESRHYGGKVNFPFDFVGTKLSTYGAWLKCGYRL